MAGESLAPLESLIDRYAQATESFQKQIKTLARQCRGNQQVTLAQRLERFFPESRPASLFLYEPSADYLKSPDTETEKVFRKLRRERGQRLMQIARDAAAADNVGLAITLLYEALYCDGDLAEAREILGQKKISGRWVSAETAARLERGQKWSDQFGWLPEKYLERYQQGERGPEAGAERMAEAAANAVKQAGMVLSDVTHVGLVTPGRWIFNPACYWSHRIYLVGIIFRSVIAFHSIRIACRLRQRCECCRVRRVLGR